MQYGREVYEGVQGELTKVARSRWQEELAAGNLGARELSRLPTEAALANSTVVGAAYTQHGA